MGKNSSKIDQDTAKTVKRKILKNNSFCLKVVFFLTKTDKNCYYYLIHYINKFWEISLFIDPS